MFSKILAISLFVAAGVMAHPAERRDDSSSLSVRTTTYSGQGTYYSQNGLAGACGVRHSDSDLIGALDPSWYGRALVSPYCGRQIHITNTNNGKTVTITVADECVTCNTNGIDLSIGAFEAIASLSDGLVPITWYFA